MEQSHGSHFSPRFLWLVDSGFSRNFFFFSFFIFWFLVCGSFSFGAVERGAEQKQNTMQSHYFQRAEQWAAAKNSMTDLYGEFVKWGLCGWGCNAQGGKGVTGLGSGKYH